MIVEDILCHYSHENSGVRAGLRRMLNYGALAGTGNLLILPVDQGFEHGPDKSFGDNPAAYDPTYHVSLAIEAGMSAFATSLGMMEAVAHEYAGTIPLILKLNHGTALSPVDEEPAQSTAALVESALTLGCSGVGFTIYPGSGSLGFMVDDLRDIVQEAKASGLFVVVWAYPRGGDLSKSDETALDVVSYSAHIAASLGANIIKVKLPTSHVRDSNIYSKYRTTYGQQLESTATRVAIVKRSCFAGKRIVVFSGGLKKSDSELLQEAHGIKDGGGNGSIVGRNAFQRSRSDALALLRSMVSIYNTAQ